MRGKRIEIFNERDVFNRRFRVNSFEFEMVFREDAFDPLEEITSREQRRTTLVTIYNKCFTELLGYIENVLSAKPNDMVGIKFQIPSIENIAPFGLRFLQLQEISAEIITDLLMNVQQSNADFQSEQNINVVVNIIESYPNGGARIAISRVCLNNYKEVCQKKKQSVLRL